MDILYDPSNRHLWQSLENSVQAATKLPSNFEQVRAISTALSNMADQVSQLATEGRISGTQLLNEIRSNCSAFEQSGNAANLIKASPRDILEISKRIVDSGVKDLLPQITRTLNAPVVEETTSLAAEAWNAVRGSFGAVRDGVRAVWDKVRGWLPISLDFLRKVPWRTGLAALLAAIITVAGLRMMSGWMSAAPSPAPSRHVDPLPPSTARAGEPYGVYVCNGDGEIFVCQLSVLMDTRTASLMGWGRNPGQKVKDTSATFRMVLGPFATAGEALQAYEANKIGSDFGLPLGLGMAANFKFDSGKKYHHVDNAVALAK
jgi:hypothetical protein